jgi:hypothetical protein
MAGEFVDGGLFHENMEGLDVLFEISSNQIFAARFTSNYFFEARPLFPKDCIGNSLIAILSPNVSLFKGLFV